MSERDGGAAFPDMRRLELCKTTDLSLNEREVVFYECRGMTLRDYFAAKALQGLISTTGLWAKDEDDEGIACAAYLIADAMLKERVK